MVAPSVDDTVQIRVANWVLWRHQHRQQPDLAVHAVCQLRAWAAEVADELRQQHCHRRVWTRKADVGHLRRLQHHLHLPLATAVRADRARSYLQMAMSWAYRDVVPAALAVHVI